MEILFPYGSKVRLKTGGPDMEVIALEGLIEPTPTPRPADLRRCQWLIDGIPTEKVFGINELTMIN